MTRPAPAIRRFAFGLLALLAVPATAQAPYPESPAVPVVDTVQGVALTDPYRWLEDQQASETRAWITAQNGYRERVMGGLPGREAIAARLRELLMVDQQGSPIRRGNRYFFSKRGADQDLSAIYMREGLEGQDVALVDPNTMAAEVPFSAGVWEVTQDGSVMVYGIRRGGEDEVLLRMYDVNRRRTLPFSLPKARYFGLNITPDKSAIYYVRFTPGVGPRLYYRTLADAASERLIFGEGLGDEMAIGTELSKDGRWLMIFVSRGTSGGNDLYLMDTRAGTRPVPMVTGTDNDFEAAFAGDQIVIQTNWNAPKGRVLITTPDAPEREKWREIVPQGELPMAGWSLAGGYLWVRYLENVVARVRGFDLTGKPFREIRMPTLGSMSGLGGEWDQDEAYFSFSSFNTPSTTFRYLVSKDERTVWWRQNVRFDSDSFEVKQVWYTSRDRTRVPMFVVHRRGLRLDGTNPTYLTAYGGFNISQTPGFSAQQAVWLERGGVLAVPNLRGGGEFGEAWHRAGMFGNKQNVFDDFIGAAEWLIANRYTSRDRLAIQGGSNGGLLVGAALTQRPELFRVVVCSVPLLDMVRYHRFLLGRFWVSEYGSADSAAQFRYLYAYSPYHRVRAGTRYPAVFFETGDGDTRVAPLHARKMTALLQAASSAGPAERPILLRYDTEAGHSGGLPVTKTISDVTERLLFVMWQLGMVAGGGRAAS